MKKEYINPTIEVINLETAQMIAESAPTVGFGDWVNSADGAESRDEFDLWDVIK